ncbi:MAG TPA: LysM domain-containing protein [Acidimicrobiales bacterium]|nr:LysM domain-containing protein [Acidimicrobiales bacterium]
MAAITHSIPEAFDEPSTRGARARAAAVRSRGGAARRRSSAVPSLFAGDGQLRRPAPPVRLTSSVSLVANDDVPPVRRLFAVAEPVRTARPAGEATAPSTATYRRRRLAVAAIVLGALLAGSWVLGALGGGSLAASERGSQSTRPAVALPVQPVSRSTYVVEPGDTLWSIARQLQPTGDVRPVVDALAAARAGRPLEVGERIVLP